MRDFGEVIEPVQPSGLVCLHAVTVMGRSHVGDLSYATLIRIEGTGALVLAGPDPERVWTEQWWTAS